VSVLGTARFDAKPPDSLDHQFAQLDVRSMLVPSVFNEPFGRVAAEALINSIPQLVSERAELPEPCTRGESTARAVVAR
jgi:hypothetical protein